MSSARRPMPWMIAVLRAEQLRCPPSASETRAEELVARGLPRCLRRCAAGRRESAGMRGGRADGRVAAAAESARVPVESPSGKVSKLTGALARALLVAQPVRARRCLVEVAQQARLRRRSRRPRWCPPSPGAARPSGSALVGGAAATGSSCGRRGPCASRGGARSARPRPDCRAASWKVMWSCVLISPGEMTPFGQVDGSRVRARRVGRAVAARRTR